MGWAMIATLSGICTMSRPGSAAVVVEAGGVGYWVHTNASPDEGDELKMFVRYTVHQEVPRLYGFVTPEETGCFDLLTSAPGVGPSTALSVLCSMSPEAVYRALGPSGRPEDLSDAVPGVGPKSAQRMAAALKDKVPSVAPADESIAVLPAASEAAAALERMGFSRSEASEAVAEAVRSGECGQDVSELMQAALARL